MPGSASWVSGLPSPSMPPGSFKPRFSFSFCPFPATHPVPETVFAPCFRLEENISCLLQRLPGGLQASPQSSKAAEPEIAGVPAMPFARAQGHQAKPKTHAVSDLRVLPV